MKIGPRGYKMLHYFWFQEQKQKVIPHHHVPKKYYDIYLSDTDDAVFKRNQVSPQRINKILS